MYVESMEMQLEALGDDERSDDEANNIRDPDIYVGDGSSDEVKFIGEKKATAIMKTTAQTKGKHS